jgi:hypothetical protein
MPKSGGLKGSPTYGFIRFQGCDNCSSPVCPKHSECWRGDMNGVQASEESKRMMNTDGMFRWK